MSGQEAKELERKLLIEKARRLYAGDSDDNIEIDDNAKTSAVEYGTWVQAWVWVPIDE